MGGHCNPPITMPIVVSAVQCSGWQSLAVRPGVVSGARRIHGYVITHNTPVPISELGYSIVSGASSPFLL